MLTAKKYLESNLSQKVSQSAVGILKDNPGLIKFHMKVKVESINRFRVTLHGTYDGYSICINETGLDVWLVYKIAEHKFMKQLKKVKAQKVSKIKKLRNKLNKLERGNEYVELNYN